MNESCSKCSCTLVCPCSGLLQDLLQKENRVLQFWTLKKKRLEQQNQYATFEKSANITLDWVQDEGNRLFQQHLQCWDD